MLITFQKSSPNREPTVNGDLFSLEKKKKKKDFTIQWPACTFKEQAFVHFYSCVYVHF